MSVLTDAGMSLLSAILGASGGIVGFAKVRELRDRRDESEIGRLRADVREMAGKHQQCEASLDELRNRLTIVEHHHGSYIARWIKDAGKRIVWLNDKAFLSIFAPLGLGREQVLERTFADLLDPLAAAEIDRLDAAALAHPDVAASNVVHLHPLLPVMVVVKVAAVGRDGELIFEGYAYRTNDRMIADGQGADRQRLMIEAAGERLFPAG